MMHIKTLPSPTPDPLKFAYRPICSTDIIIANMINLALTHMHNKDFYVRMLFLDFGSAFNTITP